MARAWAWALSATGAVGIAAVSCGDSFVSGSNTTTTSTGATTTNTGSGGDAPTTTGTTNGGSGGGTVTPTGWGGGGIGGGIGGGPPTAICDERLDGFTGYDLCPTDSSICQFWVNDPALSCGQICSAGGLSCTGSAEPGTANPCLPLATTWDGCATSFPGAKLCRCDTTCGVDPPCLLEETCLAGSCVGGPDPYDSL